MAEEKNYALFFALLKQMQGVDKEELIREWTAGRTSSLRALEAEEYQALLSAMREQVESLSEKKKLRSAVLRQLQLYGIDTTNWEAVDRFCTLPRIAGKRFCRLQTQELRSLLVKMRSINQKKRDKAEQACKNPFPHKLIEGQLPN